MKRAFLFILVSFIWLIGGIGAISAFLEPNDNSGMLDILMWTILIGFAILFLIGTALWSKAKGYHPILGVILGWTGPLGLLILVFLPDQRRT